VLLAFDGSVEGGLALGEGARLARLCGADVFLLAVVDISTGIMMAEGAGPGPVDKELESYRDVLDEGLRLLRSLGLSPQPRLESGDPAEVIASVASEIAADLVVVGHRRQSGFARWWKGSVGANLLVQLHCSLLIAQPDASRNGGGMQSALADEKPGGVT
jgi:nucleotide-binding universal stress UspA family protein